MERVFGKTSSYWGKFLSLCTLLSAVIAPCARAEGVDGRWVCTYLYQGSGYPQEMRLTQEGTSLKGQGFYVNGTSPIYNVSGTVNGAQVEFLASYLSLSYSATSIGTLQGNTMSGSWTSSANQAGSFTCNRDSSAVATPTPSSNPVVTPTATPSSSGLRPTGCGVFCNRTGVGLSVAKCSLTVGDAGGPPRTLPTGVVSFSATGGLLPGGGSCALQQTQYSPGVGSCEVELSLPINFPIGVKFPIDITYEGNSVFEGCSTSHSTINAACVGDQNNPCSGAVALSFATTPQIIKNALSVIFECGSTTTSRSISPEKRADGGSAPSCQGRVSTLGKIAKILAQAPVDDLVKLKGRGIFPSNTQDDLLRVLQEFGKIQRAELEKLQHNEVLINKTMVEILNSLPEGRARGRKKKARKLPPLNFGQKEVKTRSNSIKKVTMKLPRQTAKVVKVFKKIGITEIPVELSVKGKRTDNKKKFSQKQNIEIGI